MRYFWTFFWTFCLIQMTTYVGSSMIGTTYNFMTGTIIAVVATILLFIMPTIIPNEPNNNHGH